MTILRSVCAVLIAGLALAACSPQNDTVADGFPEDAQFDYQLGGAYKPSPGVSVVVRDVSQEPADGIYSICYLNAFQTQPGKSSSWMTDGLVLNVDGEPLADPDWPDEYILDTGTEANRVLIAERIGEGLGQCADRGFDAVELDNLDSYSRSAELLTLADNVELARALVLKGHNLGMLVGQKNAAEESPVLKEAGFDFAVAEQCIEFNECSAYTDVYGTAVLGIEYPEQSGVADPCAADDRPAMTILRDRLLTVPGDTGYLYRRCQIGVDR
ncbi:endo alpha-1,4 polygalactosaminidase [Arthrobacter sp. Hz1]